MLGPPAAAGPPGLQRGAALSWVPSPSRAGSRGPASFWASVSPCFPCIHFVLSSHWRSFGPRVRAGLWFRKLPRPGVCERPDALGGRAAGGPWARPALEQERGLFCVLRARPLPRMPRAHTQWDAGDLNLPPDPLPPLPAGLQHQAGSGVPGTDPCHDSPLGRSCCSGEQPVVTQRDPQEAREGRATGHRSPSHVLESLPESSAAAADVWPPGAPRDRCESRPAGRPGHARVRRGAQETFSK